MKKIFFILILVNIYALTYSQTINNSNNLKTIKEVIAYSREGVDFIDNAELIERINANSKLILLDVRNKEEYDAGHFKGATWLERGLVEYTMARTLREPDAEIIVYCAKGNRSAQVVKALKNMGYKNVKSHIGLEKWVEEGYSIYNYLGEIKVVKLREVNSATNPIDYYLDKRIENHK
ncbi:rhodanese-like domain-containing protein [Paludibacteraceae bacterium OttesenSCG-928-F17]|nr:rhodanese-like domain-containing protein [Paludibacteraceae bacterium OttesenSCG-928-F17]